MRRVRMTLFISLVLMGLIGTGFGLAIADRNTNPESRTQDPLGVEPFELVYQFTGVTDDGEQGSISRKEATSVICTNLSGDFISIEVRLYQWDRATVYTGTLDLVPNQTGTWATQNTEIYFDDAVLNTSEINQGSGEILSTHPEILCNVQILDPLNDRPEFMETLPLYDVNGSPVGDTREVFLPAVRKNLPRN